MKEFAQGCSKVYRTCYGHRSKIFILSGNVTFDWLDKKKESGKEKKMVEQSQFGR